MAKASERSKSNPAFMIMSEQESEESRRISLQVTSLSTQLIESIDKQTFLEEKLNQANKKLESQRDVVARFEALQIDQRKLQDSVSEKDSALKEAKARLKAEQELRRNAELEVSKLSKELEDLTASLFSEANNMVADARREKYTTEVLNSKLVEQLKNKDTLLETLNEQLKSLKKILQDTESEAASVNNRRFSTMLASDAVSIPSTNGTPMMPAWNSNEEPSDNVIIYSPNITSIRYDLPLYNEFLKFIAVLPFCKSIRDTLSESKLLKRLVSDEIQPILKIDSANGIGWLAKKSLLQQMMDGLVVVEPISGVNETYQINSGGVTPSMNSRKSSETASHLFNFPPDSPPVAVRTPCAICGEDRDDQVEHARMHMLKTQNKTSDGKISTTGSFPLCFWCLTKVRQTCEIFAFLRSLKYGAWNLEQVVVKGSKGETQYAEVIKPTSSSTQSYKIQDKKSKRMSFMAGLGLGSPQIRPSEHSEHHHQHRHHTDSERPGEPSTNCQRAWLQLCKLRCMLFWSHVGIWSVNDSASTKIGPISRAASGANADGGVEGSTNADSENWQNPISRQESFISHRAGMSITGTPDNIPDYGFHDDMSGNDADTSTAHHPLGDSDETEPQNKEFLDVANVHEGHDGPESSDEHDGAASETRDGMSSQGDSFQDASEIQDDFEP